MYTINHRYVPPDPILWQGREDIPAESCFYHHIKLLDVTADSIPAINTSKMRFALVGFKCDEGIARDLGRVGAQEGPTAIRQYFAKLPLQNPNIEVFDAGNIVCNDHDLESSQAALGDLIAELLNAGLKPIVIGGGHELAWGQYLGISKALPADTRLGILNFDAHFDLNPLHTNQKSSALTAFYQIINAELATKHHVDYNCIGIQHAGNIRQSFEYAKKHKVNTILADEMHQGLTEKCFDFIDRIIDENEHIYVSLSLDVFAPAFAPGVGTIQPLGLNPWHIIPLLRQIASSGKVTSYDIAEYLPRLDIDHCTAKLAAVLIYEIIHHHRI